MTEEKKIAFIISLPRSGSTLLQRLLSGHPDIESAPESWLFLHLLAWRTDLDVEAEYDFRASRLAISEFLIGDRWVQFSKAIRSFAESVASDPEKMFLEKTPRNALVVDQIREIFPQAKIIILYRNPIVVANSMLGTWGQDGRRWRLRPYFIDFYKGLSNMIEFDLKSKSDPNVKTLKYEDLVAAPAQSVAAVVEFLGLAPNAINLEDIGNLRIEGTMGDKTGVRKYRTVSGDSAASAVYFCNGLRRRWARRYLRWVGQERLSVMGYNLDEMLKLVDQQTGQKWLVRDIFESLLQMLKVLVHLRRFSNTSKLKQFATISELS